MIKEVEKTPKAVMRIDKRSDLEIWEILSTDAIISGKSV
jgi:hypothetical protein